LQFTIYPVQSFYPDPSHTVILLRLIAYPYQHCFTRLNSGCVLTVQLLDLNWIEKGLVYTVAKVCRFW